MHVTALVKQYTTPAVSVHEHTTVIEPRDCEKSAHESRVQYFVKVTSEWLLIYILSALVPSAELPHCQPNDCFVC